MKMRYETKNGKKFQKLQMVRGSSQSVHKEGDYSTIFYIEFRIAFCGFLVIDLILVDIIGTHSAALSTAQHNSSMN